LRILIAVNLNNAAYKVLKITRIGFHLWIRFCWDW